MQESLATKQLQQDKSLQTYTFTILLEDFYQFAGRYFSCGFKRAGSVSGKSPVWEIKYLQDKNMKMWYQQPKFN